MFFQFGTLFFGSWCFDYYGSSLGSWLSSLVHRLILRLFWWIWNLIKELKHCYEISLQVRWSGIVYRNVRHCISIFLSFPFGWIIFVRCNNFVGFDVLCWETHMRFLDLHRILRGKFLMEILQYWHIQM